MKYYAFKKEMLGLEIYNEAKDNFEEALEMYHNDKDKQLTFLENIETKRLLKEYAEQIANF